ncbi:MAG: sugar ABC transporter substrate-binding protein, partial [Verrucomicrobiota bacterium]
MNRRYWFLSLLIVSLFLSACREGDGGSSERYAFITNGVAEFWTIAEAGASKAAEDLGVDVSVLMPGSLSDQKQMMEDALTRGVDGIA